MIIINNTDLSYSTIGLIIDNIQDKAKGSTNYYGKVELCEVEVALKKIRVQIRYLKRYVEWRFDYEKRNSKEMLRRSIIKI